MIKKYLGSNGEELWEVYVNIRSGTTGLRTQKRIKSIETEVQAKRIESQTIRDCERVLSHKDSMGVSWNDLVEKYELYLKDNFSEKMSVTTQRDYIGSIRKHTDHWMKREASGITNLETRELFNRIADSISLKQKNNIKMILTNIFRYGMESNLIKGMHSLPTAGIQFKRPDEVKQEILTLSEIRKLLATSKQMDYRWYPIWAFALLTGMRNGELFALTWDDIDLENKIMVVSKSYNKRTRKTKSTKSGYRRHIPVSSELEILLRELKLKSGGSPFVLPRIRDWGKGYQAQQLRMFCQSLGLPSIKFHTLRACFATQLLRQGIPAVQIQKICGWKDLETMQRYIRMAGIEVTGVTEGLKILPDNEVMGKVMYLQTT
jgi:integrase